MSLSITMTDSNKTSNKEVKEFNEVHRPEKHQFEPDY